MQRKKRREGLGLEKTEIQMLGENWLLPDTQRKCEISGYFLKNAAAHLLWLQKTRDKLFVKLKFPMKQDIYMRLIKKKCLQIIQSSLTLK